jgi:hypothetical protein
MNATEQDYRRAAQELESYAPDMPAPTTDGEVWTVLDAVSDGDDAAEHLEEYRFWRSPHGRQIEEYESP